MLRAAARDNTETYSIHCEILQDQVQNILLNWNTLQFCLRLIRLLVALDCKSVLCSLPHNQSRGVSGMKAVIEKESDNININFSGQKQ